MYNCPPCPPILASQDLLFLFHQDQSETDRSSGEGKGEGSKLTVYTAIIPRITVINPIFPRVQPVYLLS